MGEEPNGRLNLSRDTLRAELGELELRIVNRLTMELEKKAPLALVEGVVLRVAALELATSNTGAVATARTSASVARRWLIGAAIALFAATATAVSTLIYLITTAGAHHS